MLLAQSGGLGRLDRLLYDLQLRLYSRPAPADIVIIEINEQSLDALGRWPWPRALHARLLARLQAAGVRAVGFDILFAEADVARPADDQALVAAVRALGRVALPVVVDVWQTGGQPVETLPFPALTAAAAALGHVHIALDVDGIARGAYLREGLGGPYWPTLAAALLGLAQPEHAVMVNPTAAGSPFAIARADYVLIPYGGPPGRFTRYPYSAVLADDFPLERLRDRIVLVGMTAAGLNDILPTPVSGANRPMPGVEIIATLLEGLREQRLRRPLPGGGGLVLLVCCVGLPLLILPRMLPHRTLPLLAGAALATFALSAALWHGPGYWWPPAAAVTVLLLAYPLWSVGRLAFAFAFLRRALRTLGREPALDAPLPTLAELTATLTFWQQLLPLAGFCVRTAGGSTLVAAGTPPPVLPHLPGRRWQHGTGASWLTLTVDGGPVTVGLAWSAVTHGAADLVQHLEARHAALSRPAREPLEAEARRVLEATRRLRAMRRFIGDCLAEMSAGVLVGDALGRVWVVNHTMQTLLQQTDGPVLARLSRLSVQGTDWERLLHAVLVRGESSEAEARAPNGAELLLKIAPLALGEGHGAGFIVNAADVSRLKEAERRRAETLHFLSHDLRSPMVSLLALVEQARTRPDAGPELLERMAAYAGKSLELADQFLQLARAESEAEIEFYELDVRDVAENALAQVLTQAAAKQMHLTLDEPAETTDTWLLGNAELLERALVNLLTNAIKYSPPARPINLRLTATVETVWCGVCDQGYGFPPATLAKLGERFARFHRSGTERGVGLGLRFVKTVAERHGGELTVESTPGQGSTLGLRLPRRLG